MKRRKNKPFIEVRDSGIQGRGVFAIRKIKRGQRIIEYTGEIISVEEEAERYDDENMDRHHTFLFSIDEDTTIDAGTIGSDARYINHSCDPNCETINDDDRIFIEAIRSIEPGEELTYDYLFEVDEDELTDELKQRYVCRCGSPNCRGTILNINDIETAHE